MTSPQRPLRILSVVTLVSPDGAFGGPLSVAVNQSRALREAGHEVVLAAGSSGYEAIPDTIDGIPLRLFPASRVAPIPGYASLRARGLTRWLRAAAAEFDVAHVHLARDLVTMPAALTLRRRGVPYVVQTHGMIIPSAGPHFELIDRLWTRPVIGTARTTFCLNEVEGADLRSMLGRTAATIELLGNGVPISELAARPARDGRPPEVLFLARLHPRKQGRRFAEAAVQSLGAGCDAVFRLAGPPEGDEKAIDEVIAAARERGIGTHQLRRDAPVAPAEVPRAMAAATVYVAPAVREPFGMAIVEALSQGTPVIIAEDGGLADFVRRNRCGLVVRDSAESLVEAIDTILDDQDEAMAMGQRGRAAVATEFDAGAVARRLVETYRMGIGQ